MNEITYAVAWNLNKKNTWSGTCLSLKKELEKKYKLYNINLSENLLIRGLRKIFPSCLIRFPMCCQCLRGEKRIHGSVFQFSCEIKEKDCFVYIDVSSSYVCWLYEHDQKLFKDSNFKNQKEKLIKTNAVDENIFFTNYVKAVFCMSHWLTDWIKNYTNIPNEKIIYVGAGYNINTKKIIYLCKKNRRKFLFVGRDFDRKNGALVVNAFKLLKEELPDAELYVAGPDRNPILDNIKGYHFLGNISQNKIQKYYNFCDVFVMPSKFEAPSVSI